jgi:hypothetical protein
MWQGWGRCFDLVSISSIFTTEPIAQQTAVSNPGFCAQVPMQRITRYPLLLARLHDLTAPEDASREQILQAQQMVQDYLAVINSVRRSDSFEIIRRHVFVGA